MCTEGLLIEAVVEWCGGVVLVVCGRADRHGVPTERLFSAAALTRRHTQRFIKHEITATSAAS